MQADRDDRFSREKDYLGQDESLSDSDSSTSRDIAKELRIRFEVKEFENIYKGNLPYADVERLIHRLQGTDSTQRPLAIKMAAAFVRENSLSIDKYISMLDKHAANNEINKSDSEVFDTTWNSLTEGEVFSLGMMLPFMHKPHMGMEFSDIDRAEEILREVNERSPPPPKPIANFSRLIEKLIKLEMIEICDVNEFGRRSVILSQPVIKELILSQQPEEEREEFASVYFIG